MAERRLVSESPLRALTESLDPIRDSTRPGGATADDIGKRWRDSVANLPRGGAHHQLPAAEVWPHHGLSRYVSGIHLRGYHVVHH